MKPMVAIVGRPNVGKSTLFNRLSGRRLAIVEDVPGVTRDRHYADTEWEGRELTLIDTGGFVPGETDELLTAVREQAQLAVEECDLILFVGDGRAGLTAADQEVATFLRRSGKPVLCVVNKIDSTKQAELSLLPEFYRLGLAEVLPISAEHNLGTQDLMDKLVAALPPPEPKPELEVGYALPVEGEAAEGEEGAEGEAPVVPDLKDRPVRLAIVGRPNVGKSTLVNALLKEKRLVASNVPGTTVDPIDSTLEYKGRKFVLTDTAGIRRKKTIAQRVESFAVVASLKVIEKSDVAVLLIDATEPAVDQDAKIAGIAEEKGRGLLIVVNKWDLANKGKTPEETMREELKYAMKFVAYAPVIFTSALTGAKVDKVLDLGAMLFDQFHFRAPTPQVNRLLKHIDENHPAPIVGRGPLRVYYMAQVAAAPPTFTLTCNRPEGVPDDYKRYITNQLRKTFDLKVPIRLFFRPRPGQAKRAARKKTSLMKSKKRTK